MRKFIATAAAAVMLASGLGIAGAGNHNGNGQGHGPPQNNPDHPAWYGLCTAWYNNENGRNNGNAGNAPPFQWLQDHAGVEEEDTPEDAAAKIAEFCGSKTPGNSGNENPGPPGQQGNRNGG